jgi:hypothetical protein
VIDGALETFESLSGWLAAGAVMHLVR